MVFPVKGGRPKVNQAHLKDFDETLTYLNFSHLGAFDFSNVLAFSSVVGNLPIGRCEQDILWLQVGVGQPGE